KARDFLRQAEAEAARHRQALAALAEGAGFRPRPKKTGGRRGAAGLNPDSGVDCVDCLRLLAEREGVLVGQKLAVSGEELDLDSRDETLFRLVARLSEGSVLREFAAALRAYRGAKKRADFLRQWLGFLHPADDRLHPDLRQINPQGVGRFSARNPNLQQAPRGSDIRSLFRAPAGRKLVVADFSAIEMRIMARLSGDRNLLVAFREGADVHRRTAAAIAGKAEEEVTAEERQAAKACGFGLIYGMTAETLRLYAETSYGVKMTPEEAEAAREAFFRAYPAVAAWHRRQDRRPYEDGFEKFWRHDAARGFYAEKRPCVRTLCGRLRVWPTVERERREGNGTYLRKAGSFTELYNTPDQGTGADIIKSAMAQVYRELLARGWEDVRLIACVHDELVLEAPEALAAEAAALLKECMERAGAEILTPVPVVVEVGAGNTWADKQ
ncbi:MAG: DNA polymerase, partial [Bacillota bacterium]